MCEKIFNFNHKNLSNEKEKINESKNLYKCWCFKNYFNITKKCTYQPILDHLY